jgi:hypothetical protein
MFDTRGDPFDAGPYADVQLRLHLGRPCERTQRRAAAGALIAWAPLVILCAVQQFAETGTVLVSPIVHAFDAHARYLVAVPLMLLAEPWCLPILSRIVRHLTESRIITEDDSPRYAETLASVRRLLRSRRVDLGMVAVAYAVTLTRASAAGTGQIAMCAPASAGRPLEEWWRLLISQPLFILLIESWLWRVLLWWRLTFRVSRLRLALLASHPDRAGGLGFMRASLWAFVPVAGAFGASIAGAVADQVLGTSRSLREFQVPVVDLLIVILILFAGPLLLFAPRLRAARSEGIFNYGELMERVGRQFEQKWARDQPRNAALSAPDFSAMVDLSSVVANVHALDFLLLNVRSLMPLLIAALLPFVPLVLFVVPHDRILAILHDLVL